MEFITLFPTVILGEKLNNISSLKNEVYYNFLNNPKIYKPEERDPTLSFSTINQRILDLPLFLDLKTQILKSARLYLDQLGHIYEDIQISNSWGTKTTRGQKSQYHYHINSYISGVYYISSGSDIVFFSEERSRWNLYPNIKFDPNNPFTYETYHITPSPSLLLLFPSYMHHQIEENKGPDRFSLAFNIIPKGEFGPRTGKLSL